MLFLNQPPRTKLGHFSADLRGDAGRSPREAQHHRNRSAPFAQTITLLAEIPSQSMTNDPMFSPLAHSFCRAARGRCECRTNGAGGVLHGKHHFLSNLLGTYHHHPLRARRASIGIEKFRLRGQHSAQDVVFCRLRLADRACRRCAALPLCEASRDQRGPLVHTSRPLLSIC